MGFNYGREKKKFDEDWKKKAVWYRAVGMSEDAIQTLYAFDWEQFKAERRYANHHCRLFDMLLKTIILGRFCEKQKKIKKIKKGG